MIGEMVINFIATEQMLPDLMPFYCNRCRNQLFKTNHNFVTMWLGPGYPDQNIPKGMGWVELKCRKCPTLYNFYLQ